MVSIIVTVALVAGGVALWSTYNKVPLPISDRCEATAGGRTTTIDPEQARNAAIISGISIKRGLAARAASIALAAAYQESGIRNLDYGHADSLGLFQQRPSKGWGTPEQVMDPWYATREFYRALERVPKWETKDINDVAQAVQRSAYPQAYRRHVPNARTLASSLTGQTPASFTCAINRPSAGDPEGMAKFLTKTIGPAIEAAPVQNRLTVNAKSAEVAWATAHQAIANAGTYGLERVEVGAYSWTHSPLLLARWQGLGLTDATQVLLTFTGPPPR